MRVKCLTAESIELFLVFAPLQEWLASFFSLTLQKSPREVFVVDNCREGWVLFLILKSLQGGSEVVFGFFKTAGWVFEG